jgi:cell division GTPase FtsZ
MKKNIAVVGCGYWGKNLVRNFSELGVYIQFVMLILRLQKIMLINIMLKVVLLLKYSMIQILKE